MSAHLPTHLQDLRLSLSAHRTSQLLALALAALNAIGVALCAVVLIIQLAGKVAA
jgi:hypothetical protein